MRFELDTDVDGALRRLRFSEACRGAFARGDRRGISRRGGLPAWRRGGVGLTLPDALLNAEATYWADDGPVLDGSGNIEAWANLGSAGSALDLTQGTAGARLIHLASDPDFDGRASAEGDTNRWMPGVASTLFDLADGDSVDLLVFGLVDAVNVLYGLCSTVGPTSPFPGVRIMSNDASARLRADARQSGTARSQALSAVSSIAAATLFAGRARLTGAATPTADTTSALADGVAGTDDSDDLGAILSGRTPGIASDNAGALASGLDGRLSIVSGKIGVWSGAELTEISDFLQTAYPSWTGTAA